MLPSCDKHQPWCLEVIRGLHGIIYPVPPQVLMQQLMTDRACAAQVSLPVVRQFVKSVEETALGTKVLKGVRPDQQLVKVVNDQLVELMGGQQEDLNDPKDGPQVLLCSAVARHL